MFRITVIPLLSGPVLSGQPLFKGQLSNSQKLAPLFTRASRSHCPVKHVLLRHNPFLAGQISTVAIQRFVQSIPKHDRTLSIDGPLFAALLTVN